MINRKALIVFCVGLSGFAATLFYFAAIAVNEFRSGVLFIAALLVTAFIAALLREGFSDRN